MSDKNIVSNLLEKVVKNIVLSGVTLRDILNELRRDNIAVVVNLDTSITTLQNIKLDSLIGGKVRSITVLSVGGGLYIQTSISDPFQVLVGDRITNEDIETMRWYGAGAGTAQIRLTGLRL